MVGNLQLLRLIFLPAIQEETNLQPHTLPHRTKAGLRSIKRRQRMRVSATSLLSYKELVESGQLTPKQQLVYGALVMHGPKTREQLAAITNMKEGSVCGRVNELLEKGLIVESGYLQNAITKKLNAIVSIAVPQLALFA
jgi:hypothetical protein